VALVQPHNILALRSSIAGYRYSPVLPTIFRTLSYR
jgi:hypothetical protein